MHTTPSTPADAAVTPAVLDSNLGSVRVPFKTFAVVQSLMMAGAVHAQSVTPASAPASANPADAAKLTAVVVEDSAAPKASSPKFTEPLRDTPQTIVVIPKAVIEQQGATSLSDVLRNTPGITFAAGEGGNVAAGDSFFMRGFDASGNVFIDGVRDTGNYTRDVFNFEQAEIAKGSAGADSGRGGASGYVNLVTKTPQLAWAGTATLLYGTANQKRATIDFNQSLGASALKGAAFRLNALWQEGGVPNRNEVENHTWGVAPSLAFGLGNPTRFTVAASYQEIDNLPDSGLPIVALPQGVTYPAGVAAPGQPVSQKNFYGLKGDFDQAKISAVTARVEHDFHAQLQLSNQTRIARNDRDALNTYIQNSSHTPATFAAATTPINPATGAVPPNFTAYNPATATITPRRIRTEQENEILSNQTNLTAQLTTGPVAHNLSSGIELTRETQFTPTWQPVAGPATDLYAPDPQRPANAAQTPYRAANAPYADARTDTAAAYVFDTLKLHPQWQLNLSGRLEHFKTRYTSLTPATMSTPTPTVATLRVKDTLFSFKTGIVFKPVEAGSVYLAYGNSFTPSGSGFTLSATDTNQNNPNLAPQETRNFEGGVKWTFLDDKLSTSLAFYRTENLNAASTDSLTGRVLQDASQLVQGVEFGLSGKLTGRWLVFGGFGYIDTQYRAASGATDIANDGASLRFTPRLSGNLWTTYILPFNLTIGGGAQYSESVVRSTANSISATSASAAQVPSYWLFSAMADYAFSPNLSLRLNIQNLTDEDSIRLNNNGGRYYPGVGRSYTLSAILKF